MGHNTKRLTTTPTFSHRLASRCTVVGLLVSAGAVFSAKASELNPEKQLDQVRSRITTLDTDVKQWQNQENATSASIAELQASIAQLERELDDNKKRLNEVQAENQSLDQQQAQHNQELADAKNELQQLTLASYMAYRHGELAVALGASNPTQSARLLTYARLLHDSRSQRLREVNVTLNALNEFTLALHSRRTAATLAVKRADDEYQRTTKELDKKKSTLASLRRTIARAETELKDLKESQQRLEATIAKLAREAAERNRSRVKVIPRASEPALFNGRLARDRGKLPWPVSGPVVGRFGESRGPTDVPWRGVVISASPGTPVRAVAPGKVIFADLLRGFGYMIILDHGENYMSLYGYNEKLAKKVGDPVARGDIVGNVGIAASLTQPGLYFELRYQGRPVDPVRWFAQQ